MLSDSELEKIAATANGLFVKTMTFNDFKEQMDKWHYPTATYAYKMAFIMLTEVN